MIRSPLCCFRQVAYEPPGQTYGAAGQDTLPDPGGTGSRAGPGRAGRGREGPGAFYDNVDGLLLLIRGCEQQQCTFAAVRTASLTVCCRWSRPARPQRCFITAVASARRDA